MDFYSKYKYYIVIILGVFIIGTVTILPWLSFALLVTGSLLDLYFFHTSNVTINKEETVNQPYSIDINRKQRYLASPEWDNKRKQCLTSAHYVCESCNRKLPLEVHHITYKNLYNEKPRDLVALCRRCHQDIHDNLGYNHEDYFPINWKAQLDRQLRLDNLDI